MIEKNKKLNKFDPKLTQSDLVRKLHSAEGQLADYITQLSGSMFFVYIHVIWFTIWIVVNQNFLEPTFKAFDPFPYGLLTMIVSLEAIFLSTFIMISQNRQALIDTYRDIEEDKEEEKDEQEQEELEEEVEDIQKDLDDIKNAILFIQQKVTTMEKGHHGNPTNGNESSTPPKK